jgi:hypothetical protein
VIADNAGGHLMQRGEVDLVIVGCDRVSARGDVCNKIGTYLKALAAHDNGVPFYVAMPTSTLDLGSPTGSPRSRSRSARRAKSPTSPAASRGRRRAFGLVDGRSSPARGHCAEGRQPGLRRHAARAGWSAPAT